jgi:hypothetical protein
MLRPTKAGMALAVWMWREGRLGGLSWWRPAPPGHEYPGYVAAPPEGGFKQGCFRTADELG